MVKKVYKNLTKEQVKRGVMFSSTLSTHREEMQGDTVHEIITPKNKDEWKDAEEKRERLLNDRFFNASHWNYNIVRQGKPKSMLKRVI